MKKETYVKLYIYIYIYMYIYICIYMIHIYIYIYLFISERDPVSVGFLHTPNFAALHPAPFLEKEPPANHRLAILHGLAPRAGPGQREKERNL